MRNATIFTLAAVLLLFTTARVQAQQPAISRSTFYSADEYQRAHSIFDKLNADLSAAQANTPSALMAQARAGVAALENNWDGAVYDSRQMDETIAILETVVDRSPLLRDRANLGDDVSRLLDLRREYY